MTPRQAACRHEPNLALKTYHPSGWRAPCAKCGIMLDIQPHLQMREHTPKKHMDKKKRIALRKTPLFVEEKKAKTVVVKPVMSRSTRRRLHERRD